MSPHNTRYKNKPVRVEVAAKFSPINLSNQMQKTKATSTSKMPSASKISSASPSSSPTPISAASSPSGEISKPKRPLSSYNLFFKHMRDEMLASTSSSGSTTYDHSKHATTLQSPSARRDLSKKGRPPPHRKIGFAEMARQIGAKWKALDGDRREHFESLARIDKQRYLREMEAWKAAGGDTGTASPTGASKPIRKVTAPKKSPRKSPPSSPKSKKSKMKAPKVDDSKEVATTTGSSIVQPAQPEEIYSHEDYVSYTIGAQSSSTQQRTQQRRLSTIAYDNVLGALDRASRHSSTSSIASTQYDSTGTSAEATGSTASSNEAYDSYAYRGGHRDFQPPMAARRVSEDVESGDSSYLYSGHYSGYNQGHYNRYYLAAPPSYDPYQQVAPSHRREITCDNLPASPDRRQFEQAGKISRRSSSNWNATMVEPIVCDKIPSSSIEIEVDFKNCQEPKWSDFDDADRLLDVLGKLDEEDDVNPPIVEPSPPLVEPCEKAHAA